jgi:hypothetical protein
VGSKSIMNEKCVEMRPVSANINRLSMYNEDASHGGTRLPARHHKTLRLVRTAVSGINPRQDRRYMGTNGKATVLKNWSTL